MELNIYFYQRDLISCSLWELQLTLGAEKWWNFPGIVLPTGWRRQIGLNFSLLRYWHFSLHSHNRSYSRSRLSHYRRRKKLPAVYVNVPRRFHRQWEKMNSLPHPSNPNNSHAFSSSSNTSKGVCNSHPLPVLTTEDQRKIHGYPHHHHSYSYFCF